MLVGADPAEEPGQVCGGEFPVERPGALVVAVHEREQGAGEFLQAGKVAGCEDFLLGDGEEDFRLVQPGGVDRGVDHDGVRPGVVQPLDGGLAAVI